MLGPSPRETADELICKFDCILEELLMIRGYKLGNKHTQDVAAFTTLGFDRLFEILRPLLRGSWSINIFVPTHGWSYRVIAPYTKSISMRG